MIKQAKWIWNKTAYEVNEYVDFIHEFVIETVDQNALFQISVDSEYMLWINGKFVNSGQYSDFPELKTYDEFPVSKYLQVGNNRIAITAYYQGKSSLRYRKGERGLIFALQNAGTTVLSGRDTLCRTSKAYKNGEIHLTTWQMGFGFIYDASKADGFYKKDYAVQEGWKNSLEKDNQTILKKRPILKLNIEEPIVTKIVAQGNYIRKSTASTAAEMMYSDYLSFTKFNEFFEGSKNFPIKLIDKSEDSDGIYFVVDLGKETCGYLHFVLTANEGTRVDIAHGEHLSDLRVRSKIAERHFADTYICDEGKQCFTHYSRRIACRYLQVHISGFQMLSVEYFGIKPTNYPFDSEATFECNDGMHNKIFKTCMDTLKLCMHEHYEDCPWREQALYGSDSRNASVCASYTLGGTYAFTRASLDLLLHSVVGETYVNLCAPALDFKVIPSFTMLWFLAVKEYTDYSGDVTFINENWQIMKKMISSIAGNAADGVLRPVSVEGVGLWNYYEWSSDNPELEKALEEKGNRIEDGLYHVFAYIAISSMVWMSDKSGDAAFKSQYAVLLNDMKRVFNQKFWDGCKNVFASHLLDGQPMRYDELIQALAVFSGICDENKVDKVLAVLAKSDNGLIKLSLSYLIYKYEALLSKGMRYASVVFEEISEKWGNMLLKGATSFWEYGEVTDNFTEAGSFCHAWSATPILVYCKYVLGVVPESGKIIVNEKPPCSDYFAFYRADLPITDAEIKKIPGMEKMIQK